MRFSLGFLLFLAGPHVLAAPTPSLRLSNSVTALPSHSHSLQLSRRSPWNPRCSQKIAHFIKSHPAVKVFVGGVCNYYINYFVSRQANYDAAMMINQASSNRQGNDDGALMLNQASSNRQGNYDAALMLNQASSFCDKQIEAVQDAIIHTSEREMEQLKSKQISITVELTVKKLDVEMICQTYRTLVKPSDK